MADKDITAQVHFGFNDDEYLPVTKCACGQAFDPWRFMISIYRDDAEQCPSCHRRLYFAVAITIFEVID